MSSSFSGVRRVPPPQNDPNLTYAPGSPERAEIKARLAEMAAQRIEIPVDHRRARDPHRPHGAGRDAAQARARAGRLAQGRRARTCTQAVARRRRGAARVGELALGRSRGGVSPGGGAARPPPGGRRSTPRRCSASRRRCSRRRSTRRRSSIDFWRFNVRVCRGALPRAADQHARHLEPVRLSRARGVRLRGDAVQLHGHRRQPARRRPRSWAAPWSGSRRRARC